MSQHSSPTRARLILSLKLAVVSLACASPLAAAESSRLKLLFLGDRGHHRPAERFDQLEPALFARGIDLVYTEDTRDLNARTLAGYDGLIVYANIEAMRPEEEAALLDYVASGKGFVPLHCASYCFLNSPKYVELVGAQFQRHDTDVFRTEITEPEHPLMKGFKGFESWDETYVHHRHNEKDRTVLEQRLEQRPEGDRKEPWTWVRTHGKGRVFYTAWGHDDRTWGNPGFHNLIERGIRWATGADPGAVPPFSDQTEMNTRRDGLKPFEYVKANVPFYPAGKPWGTVGESIGEMQLPLPPGESLQHMITPVGFEPLLFASEPLIGGKPMGMTWDERGRTWIAETVDYPNEIQPEGKGRDRIRILEDTDGDGRADRSTVFADKLSIPTSLAFWRGGVIAHQMPHTLYLKDTTGDGVADERRVLFTGWSTGDTHAGPSNLHYGLDNWLWGIVGYSGFEGEVGGERVSFRTGFYRFKPDGSRLEFLRNTNNNSWGVGFNEEGVLFGSTANGNPSEYMPIPNRYYEAVRGWSSSVLVGIAGSPKFHAITEKVRQVDHHGGFTAGAGHALYTARTYPREYWNRAAFVTEGTGHLAATFLLQPNGAGYRSRIAWNLLASDDEWTAPILAEVGPDGHVWVIDWYNYIVQHNPTPAGYRTGKGNAYETHLRDKKHGRIYRVAYKAAPAAKALSLAGASPASLIATLKHENLLWRLHAQRLLVERGKEDVVPALIELVKDPGVDEIGLNAGAIHALWTLHGLGALEATKESAAAAAAVAALRHRSAGVRRNAVMVLPRVGATLNAILDAKLINDRDGQVRLAAYLALAEMPASRAAGEAVAAALAAPPKPFDRWLLDAATSAAAAHDVYFLDALTRSGPKPGDEAARACRVVSEHYGRGAPAEAGAIVIACEHAPGEVAAAIVAGLEKGWPKEKAPRLTANVEKALGPLIARLPAASRGHLVRLAGRWGLKSLEKHTAEIAAGFLARASDVKETDRARVEGARQLVEFRKPEVEAAREILGLINPRTGPELAQGLVEAVSASEAPGTGAVVVECIGTLTPAARPAAIRLLLGRAEWTGALLEALEAGEVQLGELSLDQKQALAAHPSKEIAARAKDLLGRGGGLPSPDRQKVFEELMPLARGAGDPAAGKAVFLKQCAKCHTHAGEGTRIGPDLTGMAVHPKAELLTNIIDPNRSVEGNYRVYTVVTRDGRVLSGLLASETKTSIELFDSDAKKHALLREDIGQLVASPKSLMPEGFEKQVSRDDIANLLEFLTHRGQYLPLPLDRAATVLSTRGMFHSEESPVERLVFDDWSPKTVEGVPFVLVDPREGRALNAILLHGPEGRLPPRMPRSVRLPCNAPAKAIHLLSGVSGWGYPLGQKGSVSMIVRLHYDDGKTEDHPLKNGEHFADYVRRVDVPGSKFAFQLRGQQLRYLAIHPRRDAVIAEIELVKGEDRTAPIVMAVTAEMR